jgi:hypothetical protein
LSLAALRERLERERDRADSAEGRLREPEAERDAERAELDAWTAGGPLARV